MVMSLALPSIRLDGFRQGTPYTPPAAFSATLLSTLIPQVYTGSSTPTFTRATTAYVTDFEGLLKQVPSGCARFTGARFVRNLLATTSQDFTNAAYSKLNASVTGSISDPFGGTAACRITATAGTCLVYQTCPPTNSALTATAGSLTFASSVWMRRQTGTGVISLRKPDNTDNTVTLTTSWQRFSTTSVGVNGIGGYFVINVTTSGDAIDVYGGMLEETFGQSNTNTSEYVSVGVLSAPYHGAGVDGVKYFITQNGNTVSSNVVTEATGAAISSATLLGYQAEGARTNLLLWSNDLTNAAWVKTTMTTAFTSTGPDGTANSATRVTASAGNALCLQTIVAAASSRTSSFWVKRITGSGNFQLTQDGAAFTTVTTTAGWTKVELNASILNATVGFRIVTNGDAFDIWCGGFEAGAFSSSPTPTTTVAVARNADVLSYVSASNWDSTTGTAYCEALARVGLAAYFISSFSGAGGIPLRVNGATVSIYDGAGNLNGSAITTSNTAIQKMASAWGGVTAATAVGGTATSTGAFDGNVGADTNFWIGADNNTASVSIFGTIRNVALYTSKKTNAELAALTA
jgi:hypothetical protein